MASSLDHSSILHTNFLYIATVYACDWTMGVNACATGRWLKSLHSNGGTILRVLLQIGQSAEVWRSEPCGYEFVKPFLSLCLTLSHILTFYAVEMQSLLFIALRDGTLYFDTSNYFCRLKIYELHSFVRVKTQTRTKNKSLRTQCSQE